MQEAPEINCYSEIKSIQQSGYINCLPDKLLSLPEMNCKRTETIERILPYDYLKI